MTRYKGQHRAARIEVEFPHHVDIIVPPGGLAAQHPIAIALRRQRGVDDARYPSARF
jgi:hypothetical protein